MALAFGAIQVAVVSFITITFSIISLCLRLWSRRILKLSLAFNDYMAIVAMFFTAGTVSVFLAAGFAAGLGVHLQDLTATHPQMFALHLKLFVPAQLLWATANTCVKFSILSLYTTIFPSKRFGYICYGTMALSLAYFISVFLETFALCKPVQYSWDKSIPGGKCVGENTSYLVAGITNLVIDAFIVALPMPMLFGLQMSLSGKLSIAGMFSLGAVICVMSSLRVLWLRNWGSTDMTYTVTPGAIYSILEPTLGVVNACLPTIRPVLKRFSIINTLNWTGKHSHGTKCSSTSENVELKRDSSPEDTPKYDVVCLDDHIPLASVDTDNNQSRNFKTPNTITITKSWGVSSDDHQENRLATPDSGKTGNWTIAEVV